MQHEMGGFVNNHHHIEEIYDNNKHKNILHTFLDDKQEFLLR